MAFKRIRHLKELIGSNRIENEKVKRAKKNTFTMGKSSPCLSKTDNLCCTQWIPATIFINQQTKRNFKIYHKVNCKSEHVIYLMECTPCHKQYFGNVETTFNIRLTNHRKDTKNPNTMLACSNFQQQDHSFNSHA